MRAIKPLWTMVIMADLVFFTAPAVLLLSH